MREPSPLTLDASVTVLTGVGPKAAQTLENLGVTTIKELLEYLPARLEDRSRVRPIRQLQANEDVVIEAEIIKVSSRKSARGRLMIQAKVADASGQTTALWFNQRYLLGLLKPGKRYYLYGQKRLNTSLNHPFFVKKIIAAPEVAPIYRTGAAINQAAWRKLFSSCRQLLQTWSDALPAEIVTAEGLAPLAAALERAHFPQTADDLLPAQTRLGFDELFRLAIQATKQKQDRLQRTGLPIAIDRAFLKGFSSKLPFTLTDGQRRAAWEIIQDLAQTHPMRRLLYGEVGSGKTAIAALATAAALNANKRVVLLAPTTALAAQHTATFRKLFTDPQRVALLTGAQKEGYETASIIVATHAAFYKVHQFENVGLVIIDEQHRFGVEERQQLLARSSERHFLMMTATPIPRSLAQTIFGSLDITYLAGKPAHQQQVKTVIFPSGSRAKIEEDIALRLKRGEPGYVICPLIENVEVEEETVHDDLFSLDRKAVTSEAKRLKARFPTARICLLNGRMSEAAKQKAVEDFKAGRVDILVSTTVVEVGIDNPAATWILIEDADQFGLSQLHQLRGRVGRGERSSVCYLADSGTTAIGHERLVALQKTHDGLKLAEEDLRLRGPGELTGLSQSGLPPLRYADWSDTARIRRAFNWAEKVLASGVAKNSALYNAYCNDGREQEKSRQGNESLV